MKWLLLLGVIFTSVSVWAMWQKNGKIRSGHVVPGRVEALIPVTGSKGGVTYKLRVAYKLPDGSQRHFTTSTSSKPPTHAVGAQLSVVHYLTNQEPDILSFWDLYFVAWIFFSIGFAFLVVALGGMIGARLVDYLYITGPSPIAPETL